MAALHEISKRFQLDLIEDAPQALGAESPFRGRTTKAGTIGEIGFFSFYPSKNLGAAGDAGMILCRDEPMAGKLRAIRNHGMSPRRSLGAGGELRYFHHVIGGKFSLGRNPGCNSER